MRDTGERADENLTILEGMAETDVRAGRASILFAHPGQKFLQLQATKLCRELLLSKLYQKNVVCAVADEAHCNVDW